MWDPNNDRLYIYIDIFHLASTKSLLVCLPLFGRYYKSLFIGTYFLFSNWK